MMNNMYRGIPYFKSHLPKLKEKNLLDADFKAYTKNVSFIFESFSSIRASKFSESEMLKVALKIFSKFSLLKEEQLYVYRIRVKLYEYSQALNDALTLEIKSEFTQLNRLSDMLLAEFIIIAIDFYFDALYVKTKYLDIEMHTRQFNHTPSSHTDKILYITHDYWYDSADTLLLWPLIGEEMSLAMVIQSSRVYDSLRKSNKFLYDVLINNFEDKSRSTKNLTSTFNPIAKELIDWKNLSQQRYRL